MGETPLITGAHNVIEQLRKAQGVTRTDLAGRLGVSTAYVTQTLNGTRNMTLKTIAQIAGALGSEVEIRTHPKKEARWPKQTGRLLPRSSKQRKRKRTRKTR